MLEVKKQAVLCSDDAKTGITPINRIDGVGGSADLRFSTDMLILFAVTCIVAPRWSRMFVSDYISYL